MVIGACLVPSKDYEPLLYCLIIVPIALYVPWCIVHGIMLKKRLSGSKEK